MNSVILASAGHRLPEPVVCGKWGGKCGVTGCPEPDYNEALTWLSRVRSRAHDSKIVRKQFIDIATQWRGAHVRFARVGDEFGDVGSPERHAVKEPQRADNLVESRP